MRPGPLFLMFLVLFAVADDALAAQTPDPDDDAAAAADDEYLPVVRTLSDASPRHDAVSHPAPAILSAGQWSGVWTCPAQLLFTPSGADQRVAFMSFQC